MDCDKCDKRHKKGMCWEDEKNAANRTRNWKSVKTYDELGSWKVVKRKRKKLSNTKKLDTKINSQPLNVPTPLPNQVEVLATINHKKTKIIRWDVLADNIRKIKQKIENPTRRRGTSACYDSGATDNAMKPGDEYTPTDIPSDKVFESPEGNHLFGSKKAFLHHTVREPAGSADVVPSLVRNSLLSARKFADAKYITFLRPEKVLIYDDLGELPLTISQ